MPTCREGFRTRGRRRRRTGRVGGGHAPAGRPPTRRAATRWIRLGSASKRSDADGTAVNCAGGDSCRRRPVVAFSRGTPCWLPPATRLHPPWPPPRSPRCSGSSRRRTAPRNARHRSHDRVTRIGSSRERYAVRARQDPPFRQWSVGHGDLFVP